MVKVEELGMRVTYEHKLLIELVNEGKMSEEEKDDALIDLIVDLYMQMIDMGIEELYDDNDPEFARAILGNIYKKTEHRLKYFSKRYKFDDHRFNVED